MEQTEHKQSYKYYRFLSVQHNGLILFPFGSSPLYCDFVFL